MLKLLKRILRRKIKILIFETGFISSQHIYRYFIKWQSRKAGRKKNFSDNISAYNVCLTHLNFPFYKFVMYSLFRQAKLFLPPIIPWLPIGSHRETQITHNYSIAIVISNDLVICNMRKVENCNTGKWKTLHRANQSQCNGIYLSNF